MPTFCVVDNFFKTCSNTDNVSKTSSQDGPDCSDTFEPIKVPVSNLGQAMFGQSNSCQKQRKAATVTRTAWSHDESWCLDSKIRSIAGLGWGSFPEFIWFELNSDRISFEKTGKLSQALGLLPDLVHPPRHCPDVAAAIIRTYLYSDLSALQRERETAIVLRAGRMRCKGNYIDQY